MIAISLVASLQSLPPSGVAGRALGERPAFGETLLALLERALPGLRDRSAGSDPDRAAMLNEHGLFANAPVPGATARSEMSSAYVPEVELSQIVEGNASGVVPAAAASQAVEQGGPVALDGAQGGQAATCARSAPSQAAEAAEPVLPGVPLAAAAEPAGSPGGATAGHAGDPMAVDRTRDVVENAGPSYASDRRERLFPATARLDVVLSDTGAGASVSAYADALDADDRAELHDRVVDLLARHGLVLTEWRVGGNAASGRREGRR